MMPVAEVYECVADNIDSGFSMCCSRPVLFREGDVVDAVQLEQYRWLQKSGQWQDANALREKLRRTLRAHGHGRRQSRELSWRLMMTKFAAANGGVPSDESSAISAANPEP